MSESSPSIAIVGAGGAVGREVLSILAARRYPADRLGLFGSARSAGSMVEFGGGVLPIRELDELPAGRFDFALLCADADVARSVRRTLVGTETVIIDNSSAFRMDPDVPLVIPEINGDLLTPSTRVVANPNCSTIMMLLAIDPLRNAFGVRGVTVTTYQAVSGAGAAGIDELYEQTKAALVGITPVPRVFPVSCAFNVFEHESPMNPETGFNGEELKMIAESRRIWNDPQLSVLPTCVRVPVERAHAQSIIVDLGRATTVDRARDALRGPGLMVLPAGEALSPRDAAGRDEVMIGRVRLDPTSGGRRLLLWACCDQLRKGAALNAVQVMERMRRAVGVA